MKTIKGYLLTLCLVGLLLGTLNYSYAQKKAKPDGNLSVLYVGYDPANSIPNSAPNSASNERYKELFKHRMPAFEALLKQYFKEVKTIDARDYVATVSDHYDVTIFDARPAPLAPEIREYDDNGKLVEYKRARYLPENFSKPVIFISSTAPVMGERLGLKLDWKCLCLDADAHHLRTEHPIFNGPVAVDITFKKKATPEDIYHYPSGQSIPKKIPMWRVQTEGYKEGKGYMIGMVSNGGGFEDSPDAEYISSGVCLKDVGAVALGQHGNFFLWGFAASPDYMTAEAKKVFVNTVHYMNQFDGRTPILKKTDNIATRDAVDYKIFSVTKKSYEMSVKGTKAFNEMCRKELKAIEEKKSKGEKLTRMEEAIENVGVMSILTREQYFPRELRVNFDMDTLTYQQYYKENRDYFYAEGRNLILDEQVKSLGIPNYSIKLLDKCISMLEQGENTQLAKEVLDRYTEQDFENAKAWRNWFEKHKDKLFFTETGGYLFKVDTYSLPTDVSDKGTAMADDIEKTLNELSCPAPDPLNPVAMTAGVVKDINGNPQAVVMKVEVLDNWHIYAFVSEDNPFIQTELLLELPEGVQAVGDWEEPPYIGVPGNPGVFVYEGAFYFVRKLAVNNATNKKITVGLSYQACDPNQCFPPRVNKLDIAL